MLATVIDKDYSVVTSGGDTFFHRVATADDATQKYWSEAMAFRGALGYGAPVHLLYDAVSDKTALKGLAQRNNAGFSPFQLYAIRGDKDWCVLKLLFDRCFIQIDYSDAILVQDSQKYTAVHTAVEHNHFALTELFVNSLSTDKIADLFQLQVGDKKNTLLHLAVQGDDLNLEQLSFLLKKVTPGFSKHSKDLTRTILSLPNADRQLPLDLISARLVALKSEIDAIQLLHQDEDAHGDVFLMTKDGRSVPLSKKEIKLCTDLLAKVDDMQKSYVESRIEYGLTEKHVVGVTVDLKVNLDYEYRSKL